MPSPISEVRRLLAEADDPHASMFDRGNADELQLRILQAADQASVDSLLATAEQTTEPIAQPLLLTLANQHRLLNRLILQAAPPQSARTRAVLGPGEINAIRTLNASIEHLSRVYYECLKASQSQKPFRLVS